MMNQYLFGTVSLWPWMKFWLLPLATWELVWKGLALWRAARRNENGWFIAILVLNTLGILPIIYLLIKPEQKNTARSRNK